MDKSGWLYVAACLIVPAIWGVGSAWIFAKIDSKRSSKVDQSTTNTPVDYSI